MSVPADLLDETNRADIVSFYGEVFGWHELPTETLDRRQLVLSAYRVDQFIFLIADDEPMRSPKMDHFGLGVATMDELDHFYQRALDYRKRDSRVSVIDKQTQQHPGVTLSSFYVGYLLPLMVEVQHFAFG